MMLASKRRNRAMEERLTAGRGLIPTARFVVNSNTLRERR